MCIIQLSPLTVHNFLTDRQNNMCVCICIWIVSCYTTSLTPWTLVVLKKHSFIHTHFPNASVLNLVGIIVVNHSIPTLKYNWAQTDPHITLLSAKYLRTIILHFPIMLFNDSSTISEVTKSNLSLTHLHVECLSRVLSHVYTCSKPCLHVLVVSICHTYTFSRSISLSPVSMP